MRTPHEPDSRDRSSTGNLPIHPGGSDSTRPVERTGSSLITLQPAKDGSSVITPGREEANTDDSPTLITAQQPPTIDDLAMVSGKRLGQFELMETVGSGGMAAVLKARDLELGRIVALKILPPQMARDPENVIRFKQEGRAAARLDHENVARAFYCGEDQGLHFIAFEFVEGDNLRTIIDRKGTIPPADCVRYMIQVSAGLAHAAARGVVHRDVKPSNLIITPDGRVKIVDMGLARHTGSHSVNGGVTQSGTTLGTFDYISPEQALDPRRADVRSDIYSLGCAFYHALTGRPPVPEGTAAKKLYAHQHEPVVDPRELNPTVPNALAAVLAKMMAKDPTRRYQTPAALTVDLIAIARMMNLPSELVPPDPSGAVPSSRIAALASDPPRLPIGLTVGIASIAVAIAVVIGMTRPTQPSPNADWPPNRALTATPPSSLAMPPVTGPMVAVPPDPPKAATPTDKLAETLRQADPVTQLTLEPGTVYDLTTIPDGLLFRGEKLVLKGHADNPPVLRLAAVPLDPVNAGAIRPQTLTIADTTDVRIEGIRFEVADGPSFYDRPDDPVALAMSGCSRIAVNSCRFETANDLEAVAVTGMAVMGAPHDLKSPETDLALANCYFAIRQTVGLRLNGPIRAAVTESAFAPHQSVFSLKSTNQRNGSIPGDLTLRHCTFLLDQKGSVVEASESAGWQVAAGYCVFATAAPSESGMTSAMMMTDPVLRPAVLKVRTNSVESSRSRFVGLSGERNVYYGVDPFANGNQSYSLENYRSTGLGDDPSAVELRQSPWASTDPTTGLGGPNPWSALRLALVKEVRVRGEVIVGARFLPSSNDKIYYPWPPPFENEPPINPRVKVWWPDQPMSGPMATQPNIYRQLEDAVEELSADDELLIRGTGPMAFPSIVVDKKLTVKSFPGSEPILVPAHPEQRSLFRVISGELILDGLEIRLPRPAADLDPIVTAVAAVAGGRKCTMQNCVITLDGRSTDQFAAASLSPSDEVDLATAGLALEFDQCLIRGSGRVVWVKAARRFDLTVANSVVALTGAFLTVDPPIREAAADAAAVVRLSRVTALQDGPLLDLNIRVPDDVSPRKWVPLNVDASECLFAPAGSAASAPLIQIAGAGDPDEAGRYLAWRSTRPNWYPGRTDAVFIRLTPADDSLNPNLLAAKEWFRFTGEMAEKSLGSVQFVRKPRASTYPSFVPADLEVLSVDISGADLNGAGAEIGTIPRPTSSANDE